MIGKFNRDFLRTINMKSLTDFPNLVYGHGRLSPILLFIFLVSLSACSSTPPPPTRELQAAELAITGAEQARVGEYASAELNQAREKLAAANLAVLNRDMVMASQLADESRVNAELAIAKTEMIKARTVNEQMQESLDVLNLELQRNSGIRQ
jgi:hypothetical protein